MKSKLLTFLLFIISTFFVACSVDFPKTENDCFIEARRITKYIKENQYEELDKYIGKYEDYRKLTPEELKKDYTPLENVLKSINTDSLLLGVKRDTITIDYGASKEYIINLYIAFFISSKDNPNKEICKYTYSKEHNNNYYKLTFWDHSIRTPRKVIMPAGGVTPPPTQTH